jgi:hypothetical protein
MIADAFAKAIDNEDFRGAALGLLAPHLSPEQVAEALDAAKAILYGVTRGEALACLAPYLSSEQLADALSAANAIGYNDRAQALGLLVSYIRPHQYGECFNLLVDTAAKSSRSQALHAVSKSINISVALGDNNELQEIVRAIKDTASWYP